MRFDDGSALLLRDALTAGTITLTDVLELAGLDRESDHAAAAAGPGRGRARGLGAGAGTRCV